MWLRSINIPPPSPCLLLKRRLCKAWLSCLGALLSSLSLPISFLSLAPGQHRKPTPPPRQEAMLSQCARKAKAISIVEAMFTFWVFILISSSQAGGQGANAQIAWGQSAEWLGQGWSFHTQCHAPKKPPATKNEREGGLMLTRDPRFQKCFLNIYNWSFWESRNNAGLKMKYKLWINCDTYLDHSSLMVLKQQSLSLLLWLHYIFTSGRCENNTIFTEMWASNQIARRTVPAMSKH